MCKITIFNIDEFLLFLFPALNTALLEEQGQSKDFLGGYELGSSDDEIYFDTKRRTVGKKYTLNISDENGNKNINQKKKLLCYSIHSTYIGIQKSFSESKSEYKDVVLFAKHYGTLFKKRKGSFMKKVDKLDALACAVRIILTCNHSQLNVHLNNNRINMSFHFCNITI